MTDHMPSTEWPSDWPELAAAARARGLNITRHLDDRLAIVVTQMHDGSRVLAAADWSEIRQLLKPLARLP